MFHRSSFSPRSFSDRSWRFPDAEAPAGLADRIGGGGRLRGSDDEIDRIRAGWDEIDAARFPPDRHVVPVVDAPPVEPAAPAEGEGPAQAGAITVLLPGGRQAFVDPATRAVTLPADGFSDEDMEAALLALCLLDFDD